MYPPAKFSYFNNVPSAVGPMLQGPFHSGPLWLNLSKSHINGWFLPKASVTFLEPIFLDLRQSFLQAHFPKDRSHQYCTYSSVWNMPKGCLLVGEGYGGVGVRSWRKLGHVHVNMLKASCHMGQSLGWEEWRWASSQGPAFPHSTMSQHGLQEVKELWIWIWPSAL